MFDNIESIWGLVLILVVVGSGGIYLVSKVREKAASTSKELTDAQGGLIKTRTEEIAILRDKCDQCGEELEAVTGELRTISAIKIDELVTYWETKKSKEARMKELEIDVETLKELLHKERLQKL